MHAGWQMADGRWQGSQGPRYKSLVRVFLKAGKWAALFWGGFALPGRGNTCNNFVKGITKGKR